MGMALLVLAAALGFAVVCVSEMKRTRGGNLLFAMAGDEDMKIATPGAFSPTPPAEETADVAANRFLRQREAGNVERARTLGERYARVILEKNEALGKSARYQDDPLRLHQQLVLYSYVVNRAIGDLAPDSMLAQTALNVFYDELEQTSPELFRHISDMAAFTLYILAERSRGGAKVGEIYAKLCGNEDEAETIAEGNELYERFYDACQKEVEAAGFVEID